MFRIPTILSAEELIDKAFKKASKLPSKTAVGIRRLRQNSVAKLSSIGNSIDSSLSKYVKAFPNLDSLPAFYWQLADILVGIDKLKHDLGAIDWCRKNVSKIARYYIRKIKGCSNYKDIGEGTRQGYGRIASLVKQISKNLEGLNQARKELKKLPVIDTSLPTIVVAGSPNVGKSLLVRQMSTARPKIAPYPFTTQHISIGHFHKGWQRYQVVDTPGLLDRPLSKKSKIERQAINALEHLADVIIFLIDPTETCGYSLEEQLNLLSTIKGQFNVPLIEVENKADLFISSNPRLKISALSGQGLPNLLVKIVKITNHAPEASLPQESD